MNMIKTFSILICIFFLASCARLSDFTNDNPVLVSIAVRQAVAKYVEVGDTVVEKQKRADDARGVLEKVRTLVNSDQKTTVGQILEFTSAAIKWDSLSASDKIAIQDILMLVDLSFRQHRDELDPNTLIAVNGVIDSAISATKLF